MTESGDAGSLPASAQTTTGAVDLILRRLSDPADEDVYKICLQGNTSFSADTERSELFDSQLFLFDSAGRGVYANDDVVENEFETSSRARLPAGDPLTPSAGGVYYLAISAFDSDPVSVGGEIFGFGPKSGPPTARAAARRWSIGQTPAWTLWAPTELS